ncbi:MAG: hypothetical protein SVO01_00310 [Thermotogota bacterium]|nr:hypothetical protein [Thermotogota bacterium]
MSYIGCITEIEAQEIREELEATEAEDITLIEELKSEGHTYLCAFRQVWGDGECECECWMDKRDR